MASSTLTLANNTDFAFSNPLLSAPNPAEENQGEAICE